MKILYVSQWLSEIGGGGEIVFRDLAFGVAKYGHSVDVISQLHNSIRDLDIPSNLHIHRVKPVLNGGPPPSFTQNTTYILNGILKGLKIIRSKKIDLIHANNLSSAVIGGVLSKIFSIPLVITVHILFTKSKSNFWKEWGSQPRVSRLGSILAPLVERFSLRINADIIHTVTDATRRNIIEYGTRSQVVVIYNGIDLDKYDKPNCEIEYKDYVLFIGRLVFNKNLGLIIDSFKEVVKFVPDAKLIVIGDGPMRQEWEKDVLNSNLRSNISFRGFLPESIKLELLRKCAALLMPSAIEGLTLTILEAFAMRKPVLVPQVPAAYEAVIDSSDGFILPLNNPKRWSEKITLLLSNKLIAREMGENARYKVEKQFDQDRVLKEFIILYNNLIK